MEKRKIGLFTLALTFIAIGVLYLVRQFIEYDTTAILSLVWPCIIMLLGLEIIITKTVSERKNKQVQYIYSKSSIILLIIVVVIISAISCIDLNINNVIKFSNYYEYSSEFEKEFNVKVDTQNMLQIDTKHTDIDIRKSDVKEVEIRANIIIENNNEQYAELFSEKLIKVVSERDRIIIKSDIEKYDYREIKGFSVECEILLPKEMECKINNTHGNIKIDDINKKIFVDNSHGDSIVEGAQSLVLFNRYGDVKVDNILGNVDIKNEHGKIVARRVKGKLDIDSEYTLIEVFDIDSDVKIRAAHEDVDIRNINGKIELDNRYGNIDVDNVSSDVGIRSKHGDINIKDILGNCKIRSEHEPIKMLNISGNINVENGHGDVNLELENLYNKTANITTEMGNIKLTINTAQEGTFKLYSDMGKILGISRIFEDAKPVEEKQKSSVFLDVGDSDAKFDFYTRKGDITLGK